MQKQSLSATVTANTKVPRVTTFNYSENDGFVCKFPVCRLLWQFETSFWSLAKFTSETQEQNSYWVTNKHTVFGSILEFVSISRLLRYAAVNFPFHSSGTLAENNCKTIFNISINCMNVTPKWLSILQRNWTIILLFCWTIAQLMQP